MVTWPLTRAMCAPIGDGAASAILCDAKTVKRLGLADRARAYLHTNCANCHRPNGPTGVNLDLRHDTPLSQTGACDVLPSRGDLGIGNARIIAPGDDARSVLLARMNRRNDANMMPPIASNVIDTAGVQLVGSWIDSLASCN